MEQALVKQGQEVEFAQTLDLLGDAQRSAGDFDAALRSYRAAAAELEGRLPDGHPIRARNQQLIAMAGQAR